MYLVLALLALLVDLIVLLDALFGCRECYKSNRLKFVCSPSIRVEAFFSTISSRPSNNGNHRVSKILISLSMPPFSQLPNSLLFLSQLLLNVND